MISFILILIASLFFTGIIIRTKSITSGRKGPGIFQPLKDIIRLLKKGAVYSRTTSFIFQIAPSIYFASVITAIMVIPLGNYKGLISFEGDFVFFAYILGVGKFFNIISPWILVALKEWARAGTFSAFCGAAFSFLGSFALTSHSSFQNFARCFGILISLFLDWPLLSWIITMVENSRIHLSPKTHLELTMVRSDVVNNSGFDQVDFIPVF
jgi:hypothetical protein